ncbi:MAG TPA: signal recognition particle protein, partial [Planctomycetota bacterium]|nr:signal recognition particle protein [Planctomycetota bacterium]
GVEPYQLFIKILHDELVELMGPVDHDIPAAGRPPTVIMMVGLQGSGKTTTTAKLAKLLQKKGRKPLMVACDLIRPAAVEQLKVLGRDNQIPVYSEEGGRPVKIAARALDFARDNGHDTVLIDTQGRLHVNEELMEELTEMKKKVTPHQVYLVIDAMTGQDAVTSAGQFNEKVGLDAVILTKLDGDARGGCALSVKAVTGKPIKFVGVGEKIANLEEFHPDRMASRILGMGDVVTLVEKAQEVVSEDEAVRMRDKILKAEFDFEDMLKQMQAVKKMGALKDIMKMIPGLSQMMGDQEIDENEIKRTEAVIQSMTREERRNPELLNNVTRKQRIAKGSGVALHEINAFMKQFDQMRHLFRDLGRGKGKGDVWKEFKRRGLM